MNIEIGKTYKIEPTFKKTVYEYQNYTNEESEFSITTTWRWGTFHITPQDEKEVARIKEAIETTDPFVNFCVSNFQNWEFIDCWDDCGNEFDYDGEWDDEQVELFKEEYYETNIDALDKYKFELDAAEFFINSNIIAEEVVENETPE